jgi:hypothetical protein
MCDAARAHKLDQLQDVSANATTEAVPTLLVEHDVQRSLGLALVIGAVAEQISLRGLSDPPIQDLASDHTDVDRGDPPVVVTDVCG